MAKRLLKEIAVGTVGQLKHVLAELPDNMPISDVEGRVLWLNIYESPSTEIKTLEVQ